jgi:hypothetical protein
MNQVSRRRFLMMCVFGGAYAVAWLLRRQWR